MFNFLKRRKKQERYTLKIKIVAEEWAAEAEHCDALGIAYTGPVLETHEIEAVVVGITKLEDLDRWDMERLVAKFKSIQGG